MAGRKIHHNIKHIWAWFGADNLSDLRKAVYDETECGASLNVQTPDGKWHYEGEDWSAVVKVIAIRFHAIVEGSEAEFTTDEMTFPITDEELRTALDWLQGEVDRAFNEEEDTTDA